MKNNQQQGRRRFMKTVASMGLATTFGSLLQRVGQGASSYRISGYGALRPVADETTGLNLLCLPDGFRYRSFGWTGDALTSGGTTPADHDGMGVVSDVDGIITLVRNHELKTHDIEFGAPEYTFDPAAAGGCTTLKFNSNTGEWLEARASLAGTVKNCAGGPTPWGTWLSCEETVLNVNGIDDGEAFEFQKDHGWIFEVPATGTASPVPLKAMGRFKHEAVAIDPRTGIVYETEDQDTAGFYRFLPNEPGKLIAGGKLEMLKVRGREDVRTGIKVGQEFDVEWVAIDDVERGHNAGSVGKDPKNPCGDELGVYSQGKAQKATTFARLEGCWFGNELVYLDSTSGGDKQLGQIWQYDPRSERLKLIFESPSADVLDSPDNLTVSPRGGIVLCEDGDVVPHRIHGLTQDGKLFSFAANNVVLNGEHKGLTGDFRHEEWAGATFSPDGKWLFVNVQTPGLTLAITGPWSDGLL